MLKGGREMVIDMKSELQLVLQSEGLSFLQKTAVHEMTVYIESINLDENVSYSGYI